MRFSQLVWSLLPLTASLARGASLPEVEKRAGCTNGPTSRNCWSDGFDINTDADLSWPTTGKTVTYNFEITNTTCNPDGHGPVICLLVNNQYPGPTIRANWGDTIVVNVKNSMADNGTSIHWHGVRQYQTPGMDGVNGITECPIAPGTGRTYKWLATQYGTSWYHAHYSVQYGDGVVGPIVIDGPASANYDIDLGAYPINEWYYQTAFQINAAFNNSLNTGVGPFSNGPGAANMLINGTAKSFFNGQYSKQVTIESGKKYRLRIVNIGVDNYMRVSLDSHNFQVIAADFVPVKPFTAQYLTMAVGQRYDVIITANQTANNYWFRADRASECGSSNAGAGRAIWTYAGVTPATPLSLSIILPLSCAEPGPLVPYWDMQVPSSNFQSTLQTLGVDTTSATVEGTTNIVVWALNTSINIDYSKPTLGYLLNGQGESAIPSRYNALPTANEGDWNYWLIQQVAGAPPIPHPIHLHGHNYFVLGQGSGTYSSSSSLNFQNPTRRDTASVYSGGWLAIAFPSNNPGAWLMHCHIAWHISEGLGMQYLESPDKIVLPDKSEFDQQCNNWNNYYAHAYWQKDDSGL